MSLSVNTDVLLDFFLLNIPLLTIYRRVQSSSVQVSNGYFHATFSENVKNHKYLVNRLRVQFRVNF